MLEKDPCEINKIHESFLNYAAVAVNDFGLNKLTPHQKLRKLFINYRTGAGLNLSGIGLRFCIESKMFEHPFIVKYQHNFEVKPYHVFYLDRLMRRPYHIGEKHITAFDDEAYMLLILCDGNLDSFINQMISDAPYTKKS